MPKKSTNYNVGLKSSKEEFLDLTNLPLTSFKKVEMSDSIFNFFPYAEVYFNDIQAIVAEHAFFVEGLDMSLKIGNQDEGYLEGNYVWSGNQLNEPASSDSVTGTSAILLSSNIFKKDVRQSKAWKSKISDVVKDISDTDFEIESSKLNISETIGEDYWYQCGEYSSHIIENLSMRAKCSNYPNSPFFTFINTGGEFYFMCLEELFSQKPVASFKMVNDMLVTVNKEAIQAYEIHVGELSENFENYQKTIFKTLRDGTFESEETKIEDYITRPTKKEKFLVRKSDIKNTDYEYFGIYDKNKDLDFIDGWKNWLHSNSVLSYRFPITVHYNKELMSGRVVDIDVSSTDTKKVVNFELSGKWLILESAHYIDDEGIPYSNIVLGKSSIDIYSKHKFKKEFL